MPRDSNLRPNKCKEPPSHEQKPPATNPTVLIIEVLDKWKDFCTQQKMLEAYQTKVSRSAKDWSGAFPKEENTNFSPLGSEDRAHEYQREEVSLPSRGTGALATASERITNMDR